LAISSQIRTRVLLVDDDPGFLKLLSVRLASARYNVHVANSGLRALAAVPQFRPQVIVTDMCIGDMTGLELFDQVRAQGKNLPVVMLTKIPTGR
jgi:two-component system response regulator GlrR